MGSIFVLMQLFMPLTRKSMPLTAATLSSLVFFVAQTAIASSIFTQIQPNRMVEKGLQFNVQRQPGQNPKVSRFAVEITPKTGELPPQSKATISTLNSAMNGFEVQTLRDIDCKTSEVTMTCRFAVTDKELKKKDLAFVFAVPMVQPGENQSLEQMPENLMYFKLKSVTPVQ
jgi:hypothetical protein